MTFKFIGGNPVFQPQCGFPTAIVRPSLPVGTGLVGFRRVNAVQFEITAPNLERVAVDNAGGAIYGRKIVRIKCRCSLFALAAERAHQLLKSIGLLLRLRLNLGLRTDVGRKVFVDGRSIFVLDNHYLPVLRHLPLRIGLHAQKAAQRLSDAANAVVKAADGIKNKSDNRNNDQKRRQTAHGTPSHFSENVQHHQTDNQPNETAALQQQAAALRSAAADKNQD